MRNTILLTIFMTIIFALQAEATLFDSGSTGADGAFVASGTAPLPVPADGVFNFTTINIPSGVNLTFAPNAKNTPVYMLASGDVTIAGTITMNGKMATTAAGGEGGPGGFRGGNGYSGSTNTWGGKGLGPGGGNPGSNNCSGGGAGFIADGGNGSGNCSLGGSIYGNIELQPLIGGSGGGGATYGGGGGGGAILIASSGTINITGSITARGGDYSTPTGSYSGAGSGGAIRLIANTISGDGSLSVRGATGNGSSNKGSDGRIRLEAYNATRTAGPVYVYYTPGSVFLTNRPTLAITSIAGTPVPAVPTGSYSQPDIILPGTTNSTVDIAISAANIPSGTDIVVSLIPKYGSASNTTATLSGTLQSSTALASLTLPAQDYASIITAQASFTIQTAFNWEGEKIERMMVAATPGKNSEAYYITETGRRIPFEKIGGAW